MSLSKSRTSAQNLLSSNARRSPLRDAAQISETRKIKFPPEDNRDRDERLRSDYFSRTRELLSTSKLSYKSPQIDRTDSESMGLHFSGMKSPPVFRTSYTTTNRNRVKFDLGDQARDRPQIKESFLSLEREPIHVSDRLSPSKLDVFPATGRNSTRKQDRVQFEELSYRINHLEKRMEADNQGPLPPSEPANTFSNSKRKSSQNGFFGRNESLGSPDAFNESQPRRSRLKFFAPEESGARSPSRLQDSRGGDETKFSKTYIDHLKAKHEQRIEDLELRYKEKCRELDECKAEATLKREEDREELQKTIDKHNEETRKAQRETEFHSSKKAQEYEFEIKSLKNKNQDLEEQLNSANRKLEGVQKELKLLETANKEHHTEHRSTVSRLEEEVALLKEQGGTKVQQLTEKYDKERKRLKESYEKLVEELSSENKQTYRKLNDDILKRDKRIKELEREKDDLQRNLFSKVESSSHEVQILQETNRAQKRNLEECREEILRLTSQLDDKKREIYILETQTELLKSEKSRYETEWLKGDKFRKSGLSFSNKKGLGMTSPEK